MSMLLPWNGRISQELRKAVMFCCGGPQEEDDSMAHGIAGGKSTKVKRVADDKFKHEKERGLRVTVTATTPSAGRTQNLQVRDFQCVGGRSIEEDFPSSGSRSRSSNSNNGVPDMGIKTIVMDNSYLVQTVEIKKRPGQTLGFYIREGNGVDRHEGIFISRIQMGTVAESNGLLHVGDEILSVNKKEVTHMSLDDVVILMSIPKKLILKIRTKKNCNKKNASCPSLAVTEQEEKPVVVLKKGRSSSATALEETEKCPDIFEPYTTHHGPDLFSTARSTRSTSSPYASIFISPQRAEAKLLNDEGDSENSSEGSLPRSVDSERAYYVGHRGYASDSAYEPSGVYLSPALSPSQYGSPSDREYLKYVYSDGGIPRKFTPRSPAKSGQTQHIAHRSAAGYDADLYSGGLPIQDYLNQRSYESKKFQVGLKELIHCKTRFGKLQRSTSPECYNSDSEVMYTQPTSNAHADSRGFASDYETYANAMSDEDPVYAIPAPRLPLSGSTELEELLRKFNSLSHELQHEQSKLQRQLSTGNRTGIPQLSMPSRSLDSSDDYSYGTPIRVQGTMAESPSMIRKAASTQTPVQPRLTRKLSAESQSHSRTYQGESDVDKLSVHDHKPMSQTLHYFQRGGKPSLISTSTSADDRSKTIDVDGRQIPRSTSRFKDLQLVKKPLQISYSEFEFCRPDLRRRLEISRSKGLDGLASIHVLSGQGLKSSKMTLRDLYCVVSVDSMNKARTMIRTGAVNFDWDEAFDIELEDAKEISFLIYNWDPNFKHRLCFHGSLILPGYVTSGVKKKISLKMEPKGLLYITLLYREPAMSLQRLPSLRKNGIFGIDLETVIKRENSGLNVPLIVHKCIEEVEKRGLEVVGIYRLCGSARRKAQLREAFEKNAASVDLSPDNVSDIHVVTGVLKDYLRELPEPLFTNALYQMLLDALSVRLPNDPDGSAKLMLSILECLPKANQETMAMVLNHLKKISSRHDKNKMPTDNLAVCFGPVLLCPSPSSSTEAALDFKKHIEVLKYLLEIWPENYGWEADSPVFSFFPRTSKHILMKLEMVKVNVENGQTSTKVTEIITDKC